MAAAPAEELTELEECRLEAYIKAIRNVRVGPRQNRGSTNDFIRLAARSTRHKNVRGLLIQAIQEDDVIQAALGSTEEIYRARLSAEVERLQTLVQWAVIKIFSVAQVGIVSCIWRNWRDVNCRA